MSRLWTFQEALVASDRLHFQVLEASACGEDLIKQSESNNREWYKKHRADIIHLIQDRGGTTSRLISVGIRLRNAFNSVNPEDPWADSVPFPLDLVTHRALGDLKDLRFPYDFNTYTLTEKLNVNVALSQLSQSLQWRRTTRPEDEAIVLGNVLGVSLRGLLDKRFDLTMKHVFEQLDGIPLDLIFVPREHITEQGCGWMPKSLINGRGSIKLSEIEGKCDTSRSTG